MGIISKGILGGFSGTVGTVVGGTWKGIAYMRSRPTRRTAASLTPAQLSQQQKFSMAAQFLQTLPGLLEQSFKGFAIRMTGWNSAMSYMLKNAISGTAPLFILDYSRILISRGDLTGAQSPTVTAAGVGKVNFSWQNNIGVGQAKDNDRALVVVHCPELNQSVYTTIGADRIVGTHVQDVPAFSNKLVHTYLGFISADGNEVATSVYTGTVNVN